MHMFWNSLLEFWCGAVGPLPSPPLCFTRTSRTASQLQAHVEQQQKFVATKEKQPMYIFLKFQWRRPFFRTADDTLKLKVVSANAAVCRKEQRRLLDGVLKPGRMLIPPRAWMEYVIPPLPLTSVPTLTMMTKLNNMAYDDLMMRREQLVQARITIMYGSMNEVCRVVDLEPPAACMLSIASLSRSWPVAAGCCLQHQSGCVVGRFNRSAGRPD